LHISRDLKAELPPQKYPVVGFNVNIASVELI